MSESVVYQILSIIVILLYRRLLFTRVHYLSTFGDVWYRKQKASPERFEHSRAKPNRYQLSIAGDPVNHSGKVT